MSPVQNISPQHYAAARAENASTNQASPTPALIDVREPWEFAIAHIDGAQLLPLDQIEAWAQTLDKTADYVVMCHHGGRSAMACQVLQGLGFTNVRNLDGGIDAWAYAVDPTTPRY